MKAKHVCPECGSFDCTIDILGYVECNNCGYDSEFYEDE